MLLMIRKLNKLPGKVIVQRYELEYGSSELSIQTERQLSGKRILVIEIFLEFLSHKFG